MSKKKGLSFEEKRSKMTELFWEKKDFFQLKDLERLAPKEKGITAQSVKEVLQSLVDDAIVDTDKIGTSVYFWSFPSKASQSRKRKCQDLTSKLNELQSKKSDLELHLKKVKVGKEDSDERASVLSELQDKRNQKDLLEKELEKFRECDPEILEKQRKETVTAVESANRWTDNVFSIKSWIKKKFNFEDSIIDKQFGIPSDFDYIQ